MNSDRPKRMLYDHAIAASDYAIRDPVLVRTRGRPTGTTRRNLSHFEHVENSFNPKRRRRCGRCGNLGQNARTCRQAAQLPVVPAAPPASRQIEDISHFDHILDDFNAVSNNDMGCRC